MTQDDFLEQLRSSRLLSAEQLEKAAEGFGGEASAEALADALTLEGLLTPFQIRRIIARESDRLILGQYRLLDELGRGGMGQVFKAFHTVMGRTVAIKVLAPDLQQNHLALSWFEREVRMLTQLQHPNIVLAYDANEVDGLRFLVMEYVEGQNLHYRVARLGPLTVRHACEMMFQAAVALQYAHEMGVVHRDIKPANLLLPTQTPAAAACLLPSLAGHDALRPRQPVVKIVDFGLARLRTSVASETIILQSADHFAGTPDYISPEQCRNVHSADIRSDIYSLGCTFYFALTGDVPFQGECVAEKLANHLMEPPPNATKARPEVPAEVSALIIRMMAKAPNERFQTPIALAQALLPWCSPSGAGWLTPSGPSDYAAEPPAYPSGKSPWTAGGTRVIPGGSGGAVRIMGAGVAELAAACQGGAAAEVTPPYGMAGETRVSAQANLAVALCKDEVETPIVETPSAADSVDPLLCDVFRQWADLVASFCEQRGRGNWNNARYRELHSVIITACQRAASGPGLKRGSFRELEELVQPWINLEAFERTEPEILKSLLVRCQRVEEILGVKRPLKHAGRLVRLVVAAALIFAVFGLGANVGWRFWTAAGGGKGRLDWRPVLAYLQTSSLENLAVLGLPFLLLGALFLILRWR